MPEIVLFFKMIETLIKHSENCWAEHTGRGVLLVPAFEIEF